MAKGKKTGGRKAGIPNKLTADARAAMESAFQGVGGVKALTTWGTENLTEFFKLWGRTIPSEIKGAGKGGAHEIRVTFVRDERAR